MEGCRYKLFVWLSKVNRIELWSKDGLIIYEVSWGFFFGLLFWIKFFIIFDFKII